MTASKKGSGKGIFRKRILLSEGNGPRALLLIRGSKVAPRGIRQPPQSIRAPSPLLIRGSKAGPSEGFDSRPRARRVSDDPGYVRYMAEARATLPRYPRTFPRPAGTICNGIQAEGGTEPSDPIKWVRVQQITCRRTTYCHRAKDDSGFFMENGEPTKTDQMEHNDGHTPLTNISNTITIADENGLKSLGPNVDAKERKRQRERERYAAMPIEKTRKVESVVKFNTSYLVLQAMAMWGNDRRMKFVGDAKILQINFVIDLLSYEDNSCRYAIPTNIQQRLIDIAKKD
uniref:Uncharacterized protein n=1 Tax=Zea mays TaxID=4577 RepID=Q6J9V9_MAIZE|nr:unknown [Zea mays]